MLSIITFKIQLIFQWKGYEVGNIRRLTATLNFPHFLKINCCKFVPCQLAYHFIKVISVLQTVSVKKGCILSTALEVVNHNRYIWSYGFDYLSGYWLLWTRRCSLHIFKHRMPLLIEVARRILPSILQWYKPKYKMWNIFL